MHTLRAFYCHELYLLCCRHVLIFTPESFSFIGKVTVQTIVKTDEI